MGDSKTDSTSSPISVTVTPITPPTVSEKFRQAAGALATELELDTDAVIKRILDARLVSSGSEKAAGALAKVSDAKFVETFADKTEAEVAMATEAMRVALNPPAVVPTTGGGAETNSATTFQILPKLAFSEKILSDNLRTGGVSKVGAAHVEALIHVWIADINGFFAVPQKIEQMITQRMHELKEPAPPSLRRLRQQIRRQRHSTLLADLLKSDDTASSVSREEQNQLLENAYTILVPKLAEFAALLMSWEQRTGDTNGLTTAALANMLGQTNAARARLANRKSNNVNTTPIRNAVSSLNDAVNATFCGLGIEAAIALFDEARFCSSQLQSNDLFALVGKSTRAEIMGALGLEVNDASQQLETNLATFTVAIMGYPLAHSGEHEIAYLCELLTLAENIPWESLPKTRNRSGFGGSPYGGRGDNDAMAPNGRRGDRARDGVR